jgi:hypothetical protein
MHFRLAWPVRLAVLALGIFTALSLTRGQERQSPPPLDASRGKTALTPAKPSAEPARDFSKLTPLQKQIWQSAQWGAEWLHRANGPDGRFVHGVVPALQTSLAGDHYLFQVGAAASLSRVARYSGDQRYAARATQAIVTLLADTIQDAQDPQVRYTAFPSASVNRLASAGLLVLAIHELPEPDRDLLAKAEQLCNYIHKQQQADGSFRLDDSKDTGRADPQDATIVYPGEALQGLIRSQQRQPAAWKIDVVRNALVYYKACWRKNPNMGFVPAQTAAYAEAFLLTKEQPFADFVFEMNDWIVRLQYQGFDDPKQVYWSGGFRSFTDGKAMDTMPQVASAAYAEGLAEGCRVARATGDLARHQAYTAAVERCLPFLTTLQYTEANTRHFADWYRPTLLGGFHASQQDGDLRVDYTQQAVSAMVEYLMHVARVP